MGTRLGTVMVLLITAVGCGGGGTGPIDSGGAVRLAVAFPETSAVTAVRYEVTNSSTGDTQSRTVPVLPFGLPPEIDPDLAGATFADWYLVLNPGDYTVNAFPLDAAGNRSPNCTPATGTATVFPSETTEILLVSQCSGNSGGLDVTVVIDQLPFIEDLEFRPSKFVCSQDTANLTATASDPDGDALEFEWTVISTPDGANTDSYCLGYASNLAAFSAEVPGRYELLLQVSSRDGSASLRFPIYVHRCQEDACIGDNVREALPATGTTLAGDCSCGFTSFDPNTDWPPGEPLGPTVEDELGCEPATDYDPVTLAEVSRPTNTPCPANWCSRQADGTYVPSDEAGATTPGCEAFETGFCVPTVGDGIVPVQDDGTRLGCDSAPALGPQQCEQVEICPDPGDVPANASQTQDPPQFNELPTLEPPDTTVPPGVVTLVDNLTRFVPPCFWDTMQDTARVYAAPVPAYGDNASGRVDSDPVNFSGAPLGADCTLDRECRSNFCDFVDEFDPQAVCQLRERLDQDLRKDSDVNPYYWDPDPKGSEAWNVDFEGGPYAADVHAQGAFYPSVGWDLNAGGDFRMDVTAAGINLDRLVYVDAAANNSNCGWSYSYEVRIANLLEDFDGFELGIGGVFVSANNLGAVSDSNTDAGRAQCEDALAALRDREELTNQRLWDAMLATALWNGYGPSDAVPNVQSLNGFRTAYENSVAGYESALSSYTAQQQTQSAHAFGIDIADLDAGLPLLRPRRIPHHMGPFVLTVETSVVGKVGVDVLLKSQTDFSAPEGEADAALGVELTPQVDVLGYMAVSGGIDVFFASLEIGLRGELQFAGLYLPLVASGGVVRDEVPIDPTGFGDCIDDATLSSFVPGYNIFLLNGGSGLPCPSDPMTTGLPLFGNFTEPLVDPTGAIYRAIYGYNAGVEGRALDGAIKAFIRAELAVLRKTWTKTLVEWEGADERYLSIGDGDVLVNSFDADIGSFTLPVIGTTVDLWPGPQRDMVFLPDLTGSAGPAGTRSQAEPLYDLLNDTLLLPPNQRWGGGAGLCGIFVP